MDWIVIRPGCEMPKDKERVLLTILVNNIPRTTSALYKVDSASVYTVWDPFGNFEVTEDWSKEYIDRVGDVEAIAWSKIPEPYKEE